MLAVLFQKKLVPHAYAHSISRLLLYPTLPATLAQRCWWTAVDETSAITWLPNRVAGHVRRLETLGVTGVVNMMAEREGPIDAYAAAGVQQLHLPTAERSHQYRCFRPQ